MAKKILFYYLCNIMYLKMNVLISQSLKPILCNEFRKILEGAYHFTTPTLLFPGLGASKLLQNNVIIYPPNLQQYFCNYDVWKQNIMLNKNLKTLSFGDKKSLELEVVPYFIKINRYENLLRNLDNIYPIPYDFRLIDNRDYLCNLYNHIRLYIEHFDTPVTLLCHSTGGLLVHWFIHQQPQYWCDKHIKNVININVPFGGIPVVLENCINDDTKLNKLLGKEVFSSLGASIWNLPDTRFLQDPIITVDGKIIHDYLDFFKLHNIQSRVLQNKDIIDSFKIGTTVKTHIIYSTTEPINKTPITINIHTDNKHKKCISTTYGNGDGIVPLESLLIPKLWDMSDDKLLFHHIPNREHSSILMS